MGETDRFDVVRIVAEIELAAPLPLRKNLQVVRPGTGRYWLTSWTSSSRHPLSILEEGITKATIGRTALREVLHSVIPEASDGPG